ncbi:MAG: hypothetical protein U0637_00070 [Phycisphaerales bacterium]
MARPRVTQSWQLRCCLCIAAGALATLATAWGPEVFSALQPRTPAPPNARRFANSTTLSARVTDGGTDVGLLSKGFWADTCDIWSSPWPPGLDSGNGFHSLPAAPFPAWAHRQPPRFPDGYSPSYAMTSSTVGTGLTFRCASSAVFYAPQSPSPHPASLLMLNLGPGRTLSLPLQPSWPGLLADIACWSAVAAAPLLAWPALVTRRRRAKGMCPACAYPLPPGRACPECGSPCAPPAY